ncbi:MAG: S-layer homology domain-containing protein [Halanaerobiales bacterium]
MKRKVLMTILVLGLVLSTLPVLAFSDEPAPEKWVYENFMVLKEAGLLKGYPDNTFRGENKATRYEMVELTARVLKYLEEKIEVSLEEKVYLDELAMKEILADLVSVEGDNDLQLDAVYQAIRNLEREFKQELSSQALRITTLEDDLSALEYDIAELQRDNEELKKEVRNARIMAIVGIVLGLLGLAN